ncbi:MAG: response regulator [Myxococcales bacterium]|nr:response regulator [Myxococcales bacterium]
MSRGRVLIVDDFEDARDLYAEFLRLQGYEVNGAADGPAALNLALPADYDVIVLDLALPRMDGLEVLRQLRGNPGTKRTPIIILSASVGQEPREDAIDAGADLFLEKPCLPDELEHAIQSVLPKKAKTARSSSE